jgi:carboxyl-terminal processing protease
MNSGSYSSPVKEPARRWPTLLATAVVALLVGAILGMRADGFVAEKTNGLDYSGLDEVYKTLQENYDGEIDSAKLIEGAKRGMVQGVGDDHTSYFSGDEAKTFQNALEGSFEGIGAELGNQEGKLTIISVLDNTPAMKAGLKRGDIIAKVDDTDTLDWQPEPAVQIIRGEKGTTVRLSVVRGGEVLEFEITRDKVTDPSVKYEIIDGVGYMRISRFAEGDTVRLAREGAKQFKDAGVRGVVLDLRGNSGGYVNAAESVASLWLDKGKLVVTEKTGDLVRSESKSSGNNLLAGLSTVVLVDGGSASASEILAGALRDNGAARLVGTKTYGKGSVQLMKPLSDGAQLKITVAKWFTPAGLNIDKEGITPDEVIGFDEAAYKNGVDVQKNRALELIN